MRSTAAVVLTVAILVSVSTAELHSSDVAALTELANNITALKWDPANATSACTAYQYQCSFQICGVKCDPTNSYVEELRLFTPASYPATYLTGTIKWAPFGWFSNLSSLILGDVQFDGCLPPNPVLANLTSLTQLSVDGTGPSCAMNPLNLTGPPLRNLKLTKFMFSNGFPALEGLGSTLVELEINPSGSQSAILAIPPSWNQLTGLQSLSMQYIKATGLKEFLASTTALQKLNIYPADADTIAYDALLPLVNLVSLTISITSTFPNISTLTKVENLLITSSDYPATAFKLPSVTFLYWWCISTVPIPDEWDLPNLQKLQIMVRSTSPLPSTINKSHNLTSIQTIMTSSFTSIPDDLSGLTSLETLEVSFELSSPPRGLATVPNLKTLEWTVIGQSVTDFSLIGNITSLESLQLLGSGNTPLLFQNLTRLTNLTNLGINRFNLTDGTLVGINALTKLQSLVLGQVTFSGALPSMAGLTNLKSIWMNNCPGITGPFPDLLDMPQLETLTLVRIPITSLPNITGAAALQSLYLNGITTSTAFPEISFPGATNLTSISLIDLTTLPGPLPVGLRFSTMLESIQIQNCPLLVTPIPTEWGELSSLKSFLLFTSGINALPPSMNQLGNLKDLTINFCPNIHEIPSEWRTGFGNLSQVTIHSNNFSTGSFPFAFLNHSSITYLDVSNLGYPAITMPDFSAMTNLQTLSLRNDDIGGPLSDSITKHGKLDEISIQSTQVTGPIPPGYFAAPMKNINLNLNSFLSATLPEFESECTLESVSISWSALKGGIPSSWAKCNRLSQIDLSQNMMGPNIGSAIFSKNLTLASVQLQNNLFSGFDDFTLEFPDGYSFYPYPQSISIQANNFTGPISPQMVNLIAKAGLVWNFSNNLIECPQFELGSNTWQKRALFAAVSTNVYMSQNLMCLPADQNTLACPALQFKPASSSDPNYSTQQYYPTPCTKHPWNCAGSQPAPNAPCIAPGAWYIVGKLSVEPTKPLTLESSAVVSGNFSISSNATVQVKPGVVMKVRGCVSISGNLIVDASNITWGSNNSTTPSSFPLIVFDGAASGFCQSGPQQFESVTVIAEQRPCESLRAVDQPSATGLSIVFSIDSTGYADRNTCEPSPPMAAEVSNLNVIGIAVGVSVAGVAVIAAVIMISVRPIRRRVFPFLERRMATATEMRDL